MEITKYASSLVATLIENKIPFELSSEIDSTQNRAKQSVFPAILKTAKQDHIYKIFIALHQSSGQGRNGRSWSDSPGCFLASLAIPTQKFPQPIFSPLLALALCESLEKILPDCHLHIKPPNDIYWKNHKIAGLLVDILDYQSHRLLVIGLGLNVFTHPNIDHSAALADFVKIAPESFFKQFMPELVDTIEHLTKNLNASTLSTDQRSKIETRVRPLMPADFKGLDQQAQLLLQTGPTAWSEHTSHKE